MRTCLVLLSVALALTGCNRGGSNLRPEAKPKGASFSGVWQSPQYGNMHLCQSGKDVFGDYVKDDRYGRVVGTSAGDLMRFRWDDSRELVKGRPTRSRGRGYFRLKMGADGDEYLQGEWGIDDKDHGGGPWNAVKLRKAAPDRCEGARDEPGEQRETLDWGDGDGPDAATAPVDENQSE
ncbi:MAG: hypothetical protein R3A47_07475 [Polyangiales bacterium]